MAKKTSKKPKARSKVGVAVSEVVDSPKKGNGQAAKTEGPAVPQAAKREYRRFSFPVGMVIQKTFKGTEHEVTVVEGGFEYRDQVFRSITAVAKRITGYSVSGPVFFGLVEDDVCRDES